ncbi:sporulation membrane protein YtaF [Natroniella sulfidigena]|uniref:sporulation membrane protein YtaF n=1 Tax=Natroniella sulfidigena TaxID=723921 RepID=UPI00200AE71E|nr:sporulation membrane protein YtaF [Natroniella sulfidigena]MCK8815795.1 sporulation membrane protein YtaF [Natroniella sulfidigena]
MIINLIAAFILAFAVSLDGFTVGITYGLKGIKINILPLLIISIASGFTMMLAMSVGNVLTLFISPAWAERIGGLILIVIGIWLFYQSLHIFLASRSDQTEEDGLNFKELVSIRISSLGLIINILQEPVKADFDYSGAISKKEAIFLGIALAMDAFGGGIGAGLAGYQPVFTSIATFVSKFVLLLLGIQLGKSINLSRFGNKIKLLPGLILVLLGLIQLL